MIDSIQDLSNVLASTLLEGREIAELPILDTAEKAYAVEISSNEVEAAWRLCRSLVPRTGRWPVATTFWRNDRLAWTPMVQEEDFFSRFDYKQAPNPVDISPRALCTLASTVDVAAFLERKAVERAQALRDDLDTVITDELEETQARCGTAPRRRVVKTAYVDGHRLDTAHDVERFLLDWEEAHGVALDPEESRQGWFQQDPSALLLLPTRGGWDTLAYLSWYGTSDYGAEYYIALGRAWERRFGAELVAHYGTMLQCLVSRPPETLQDAWTVAREHDLAAECTLALPGIRLRDYARALIGWDRWFLHERP